MTNTVAMDKRELLSIFFKKKWMIASVFFSLLFIVVALSFLLTPYYQAETRILVKNGREFQPRSETGQGQPANGPAITKQEIINSEIEIMNSRDLAASVIQKIGIEKLYPKIAKAAKNPQDALDAAVGRFQKTDFKADSATKSDVIDLIYLNPDRELAVATLKEFTTEFEAKHTELFGEQRSGFLGQQADDYDRQLTDIAAKLTAFRQQNGLYDAAIQRAQLIQDRASVETELRRLQAAFADANDRATYYRNVLKKENLFIQGGTAEADAVEAAKTRVVDLRLQLSALRQRYSTDVKPILDLKDQIASVEAFINGHGVVSSTKTWHLRNPLYDDAAMKLQGAEADILAMNKQIEIQSAAKTRLDNTLSNIELADNTAQEMERQYGVLQDLARTYRNRFEDAKINEDLDRERMISVIVIQSAEAVDAPVKPKRILFIGAGAGLGLVAAGLVLIYFLMYRQTFITSESVGRLLGVQVVVAVPDARRLA